MPFPLLQFARDAFAHGGDEIELISINAFDARMHRTDEDLFHIPIIARNERRVPGRPDEDAVAISP